MTEQRLRAMREYSRKWRISHLEERRAYGRQWISAHPVNARKASRKYRAAHPEKIRESSHKRYMKNPEVRRAYRIAHRDLYRTISHNCRARMHGSGGTHTVVEWIALKERYGNRCLCCGLGEMQLKSLRRLLIPDHVIPIAKGGTNDIGNLQPLCHGLGGCNNHKHDKHLDYRNAVVQSW